MRRRALLRNGVLQWGSVRQGNPRIMRPYTTCHVTPLPLYLCRQAPQQIQYYTVRRYIYHVNLFPTNKPVSTLFTQPTRAFHLIYTLNVNRQLHTTSMRSIHGRHLCSFNYPILPINGNRIQGSERTRVPQVTKVSQDVDQRLS